MHGRSLATVALQCRWLPSRSAGPSLVLCRTLCTYCPETWCRGHTQMGKLRPDPRLVRVQIRPGVHLDLLLIVRFSGRGVVTELKGCPSPRFPGCPAARPKAKALEEEVVDQITINKPAGITDVYLRPGTRGHPRCPGGQGGLPGGGGEGFVLLLYLRRS